MKVNLLIIFDYCNNKKMELDFFHHCTWIIFQKSYHDFEKFNHESMY